MASTSNYEQSGRHRRRNGHILTGSSVLDVDKEIESSATCIDLTIDAFSDDIIDLTRGHSLTAADSQVEVSSSTSNVGAIRTRRRTGRRSRPQTNSRRRFLAPVGGRSSSSVDTASHVQLLSDDSDSDSLPELPFAFTPPSVADIESARKSTEGVKISCPVCLDDAKQIRGSGRQVVSTNCGHIFCDVCIREAITIQHTCPTCRKKITQRSVHPLFL